MIVAIFGGVIGAAPIVTLGCVGHRHRWWGAEAWSRIGNGYHKVPAKERRAVAETCVEVAVAVANGGPVGVGGCQEPLSAELRIHAIVDIIHPAAERCGSG